MSNGIKTKKSGDKFFTIEFFGVTVILASLLLLVCLLFGKNVFFEVGYEVQSFLLGLFGYFSYPLLLATTFVGFVMLLGKKPNKKFSKKTVAVLCVYLFLILAILTVITSILSPKTFGEYISHAYNAGRGGLQTTVAGGVLFSLIVYLPVRYITFIGAIVLFALIAVILTFFVVRSLTKKKKEEAEQVQQVAPTQAENYQQPEYQQQAQPQIQPQAQPFAQPYSQPQQSYNQYQAPRVDAPYVNPTQSGAVYSDRDLHDRNMQILYGGAQTFNPYQPTQSVQNPTSYQTSFNQNPSANAGYNQVSPTVQENEPTVSSAIPRETSTYSTSQERDITPEEIPADYEEFDVFDDFDTDLDDEIENVTVSEPTSKPSTETVSINVEEDGEVEESEEPTISQGDEYAKRLIENMPKNYRYTKPPLSLFKTVDNSANNYDHEIFKAETSAKILATLKTFGVDTKIAAVYRGPAVTRFDIEIPPTVSMAKVTKLYGDINLRIAARSAVRMIAPVPNTSYVGIEVPNNVPDSVAIKDILVSDDFMVNKPFSLIFALGKDVIGKPVSLDLADMPHMLVTGTTGSGKSVCLNSLVVSLISKYGPDELRFVIVDPKRVDLEPFKDLPHMMFGEIIEDVPTTNAMLGWAVQEMERRYEQLAAYRVKNIKDYNIKARQNGDRIIPRIVIMMDEFADIMLQDKKGVAVKVTLIAQKARAAGIHLVLAAQRPSVDVVEGPIKSNLPTRLAFRASSLTDSMVSLGEQGAEKLLGRGDCLYKTGGMLNIERVMGAYVSDDEMFSVIDYVSEHNDKYYDYNAWAKIVASVQPQQSQTQATPGAPSEEGEQVDMEGYIDPLYIKAMRIGFDNEGLSVSLLQRRLAVGYPRAGKIIDWLEDNGYITPNSIKGKRQMVITREAFEEKFGAE